MLEEEEEEQQLLNVSTSKDTIASDDGSSDSPTEDSETLESTMGTSPQAHRHERETDHTVLPNATSGLTCADVDEKIDLATLDLDDVDAVDLIAEGIHRTHCSSREEETHSGSQDDFSYIMLRYVVYVLFMSLQQKRMWLLNYMCNVYVCACSKWLNHCKCPYIMHYRTSNCIHTAKQLLVATLSSSITGIAIPKIKYSINIGN